MTTDTWSSKHGQGRYVTYTSHWVNLVMAGKQGMRGSTTVELVSPPRVACGSATTSTPPSLSNSSSNSSSNSASSSASSSSVAVSSTTPCAPTAPHRLFDVPGTPLSCCLGHDVPGKQKPYRICTPVISALTGPSFSARRLTPHTAVL
ncbi:hypothetical protein XENTR_v10023352 [Xenopus tropicalis]|nr:hypothetical protein XENTR_v10023352 [Xenopus tropicalis]